MATMHSLGSARIFRPRPTARAVLDFLAKADARYRARKQMRELDDHLLRDIGIARADLDAEISRTFPW